MKRHDREGLGGKKRRSIPATLRARCGRRSTRSSPAWTPASCAWPRSRAANGSRTSGSRKRCCFRSGCEDNRVMHAGGDALLRQGRFQVRQLQRNRIRRRRLPGGAARHGAARRLHREKRGPDALLRQHRRLCRRGDHGRYLGHGRVLRPDRQERAPLGRGGHRRRARADPGEPGHHRGQLLRRRALGGGRRRDRGGEQRHLDGRILGQSTKIYDRATGEILYGRVPAGSVVVSGNLPSPDGRYGLYCAVIVKKVDAKTRAKTSLNELLRGD